MDKEFNSIKSKEIKNIRGYVHSKNADGTLNVCFNMGSYAPKPNHLHRYTEAYLEKYYQVDGKIKWVFD